MASVDRIQGLSGQQAIKTPCRLATTANITLSGEQTIDGVAAVEGDRVLVKDQADTTANGVYDVSTGSWTRSLDFDGANDIKDGTMVLVGSGNTNADLVFKLNATEPITIGTTALTFSVAATFNNISAFGATLLDDANAAAARTTLDARGASDDVVLIAGKVVVFEGTTADAFELTVSGGDPTADRTQTHQDATGTIALIGVKEMIGTWPVGAMKVRTTNGCASLTWDESATNKVMTGYMAFDKDAVEYAQFSFRAPAALDESANFTARFVWKEAGGATAHNCVWQIEMQAQGDADTIDSAWGTAVTVTDTGAAGKRYITDETGTITPAGSWAAGDEILVQVSRKATDGADTLDVDAHLIEVSLFATYAVSTEA